MHLEELHQRTADRHVVFDDEHEARGIFGHARPVYRLRRVQLRELCGIVRTSLQRAPSSVVEHVTFKRLYHFFTLSQKPQ